MGAGESTASTADENGKTDGETEGNHNERLLGQLGTLDLGNMINNLEELTGMDLGKVGEDENIQHDTRPWRERNHISHSKSLKRAIMQKESGGQDKKEITAIHLDKAETELEMMRTQHLSNTCTIESLSESIAAIDRQNSSGDLRAAQSLDKYAQAMGMTTKQIKAQVMTIKTQIAKLKEDNKALTRVMDNRNSQRLARTLHLGLASKPLSPEAKVRQESRLHAMTSKILMTERMLKDLDSAEVSFPEKQVKIAVRRYLLKKEMAKLVDIKEKMERILNPKVIVMQKIENPGTALW